MLIIAESCTGGYISYIISGASSVLEKGIILDINTTAIELTGLDKQKIIGKTFSELKGLFSREDMKKHLEAIEYASSDEQLSFSSKLT